LCEDIFSEEVNTMNVYKIIFTILIFQVFAFSAPAPVPSNLVAWYAGDGNANDISGNNLNPTTVFGASNFSLGKVGQSMYFTAVPVKFDYFLDDSLGYGIADNPLLDIDGDDSFSVEFWTKADGLTGIWVDKREQIGIEYLGYAIYRNYNGTIANLGGNGCTIAFDIFQPGVPLQYVFIDSNIGCTDGNYTHYAFVFDRPANRLKIYINGNFTVQGTPTMPIGDLSNNADFHIAHPAVNATSGPWLGKIDELSVYKKALSGFEIQDIYFAGSQGKDKTAVLAVGNNVMKTVGDVTATFPTVNVAGTFNEIPLDSATLPALPSSYLETGLIYDISATAVYSGSPTLCFNLPSFTDPIQFARLKILHLENSIWTDRTTSSNFATHQLCAQTSSFSPFAIADRLAPTAANISIRGRILTSRGRGIARARVSLTNANGEIRRATANSFGYYSFDEVISGETYIINVTSKIYQFNSQVITPNDNLDDVNFISN
jgi:Concanavalin A-like lectin/glucanases superfamily